MASGWAGDGAVQDQIDSTIDDAVARARRELPRGESNKFCDECGEPMPADITQIAISDFDPDDYKKLCPECASKFASSDEYIDYTLN